MLGNKKIMGDNIQFFMDRAGIERRDFAKAIGVPYSSLTDWLNGRTYPRIDKIERMAQYFGIEKADLVEDRNRKAAASVRIPVYSRVAAGIPLEASGEVVDYEEIPEALSRSGEYFGLRVEGNSMEPKISDGDTIIVRKQDTAEPGEIVVVIVNGSDACVKRLKTFDGGIMLISTNPAYEPIMYTQEEVERLPVRIIGKVVELRAKF